MNRESVYAWAWWVLMIGLFIVWPVLNARYHGTHRPGRGHR